jgi:chromosome segregation protein
MYLKELTINGFKSFARKSELEFSASITAIVGPNGSGKSNVAESFRFVLGEQSVKSMRGKRGEDLIWGGSEKISRGNRASVEVVFDNSSRVFALDFDEVKIERIVHRDGQNEYKLNNSNVRLKDIHELLAVANVGSTGHHIISQGEADRVLAAGPRERREMIEDALGLKVYQLKKQEAERKLEKTKENIAQVESLQREAGPHLKYLKKQVEKAERSLEVQKLLRIRYAEYLKREDTYVAFHHDRLLAEKKLPTDRLKEVEQLLQTIKQSLVETDKPETPVGLEIAKEEYTIASRDRQTAERELGKLEGQISYLERRLSEQKEKVPNPTLLRSDFEKMVEKLENYIQKVIDEGGEVNLKKALIEISQQLRIFLKKEPDHTEDLVVNDKHDLEQLRHELKKAEELVAKTRLEEQNKRDEIDVLQASQLQTKEKNHEAERKMFELLHERRGLESQLALIDRELAMLERDRSDFKQQLQEAVTLLGRGAVDYYTVEICDENGKAISDAMIVEEGREVQRARQHELEKLKIRLEELGVGATDDLLKEYKDATERNEFLNNELKDLAVSVDNLRSLIVDLEEKLSEQFNAGLLKITKEFQHFFTLMFGGGSANLSLVKPKQKDEGEEGLVEEVQTGVELQISLPNKRVKGLEMLSGGERALTSIALIFAMSQVNPPPFIILDETDAALDEANSRRYGDMIEALAKKSQLVLITHNRETMSRAGILYGITMGIDGASKILSVKFDEAVTVAK